MKIGSRTTLFNFAMRERRAELGWSQEELAQRSDVPLYFINAIESLRMPFNKISTIIERLNKISNTLEMPFSQLFPQDYLDAIQANKLPHRRAPIIWCREISIDVLPPSDIHLLLPSPEDDLEELERNPFFHQQIEAVLNTLSEQQAEVIKLRFGIDQPDNKEWTLREIAEVKHMTIGRVRQIEAKAFRRLRHPFRSSKLREYLWS